MITSSSSARAVGARRRVDDVETARALRSGRDALVTVTRACEDVDELMRDLEGGKMVRRGGRRRPGARRRNRGRVRRARARDDGARHLAGRRGHRLVSERAASSIAASREETAEATKESPRTGTAVPSPG